MPIEAVVSSKLISTDDVNKQINPKREANTFGALSISFGVHPTIFAIITAIIRKGLYSLLKKALTK